MERETDERKHRERRSKTPGEALDSLMRLASKAEKSSGDALRLMRGWGVGDAESREVLKTLIEQRFIDDRRYAEAYVNEKSRLNGWGKYKIRRMLTGKGIEAHIIDEALRRIGVDGAKERLVEMLARKMKTTKAEDGYHMKGKLMRYGLSLGYGYDDVTHAVELVSGGR